jgi:hypothetical protein
MADSRDKHVVAYCIKDHTGHAGGEDGHDNCGENLVVTAPLDSSYYPERLRPLAEIAALRPTDGRPWRRAMIGQLAIAMLPCHQSDCNLS